jgi:hypothetical protein
MKYTLLAILISAAAFACGCGIHLGKLGGDW